MKAYLLPLSLIALAVAAPTSPVCNQDLLSYYGLTGAKKPAPYQTRLPDMDTDLCPTMQETCCLSQDFNLSVNLWEKASTHIMKNLSQLYSLLQVMAISQSLVAPFLANIQATNNPACRRIDTTFFKSPISFDQMITPIKIALETFANIQKGFYCMICDAETHGFFEAGRPYGRLMVSVQSDFCSVLIEKLNPFLSFKIFYFDPMVINMNAVIDCANGYESAIYDSSYRVGYDLIRDCLSEDTKCEALCNEFRFGSTSNLFIGKLSEYRRILADFQAVIKRFNPQGEMPTIEAEAAGETVAEFFGQTPFNTKVGPLNTNLSRFDILLGDEGVNPFEFSQNSRYEYIVRQGQISQATIVKRATVSSTVVQKSLTVETGDKLATLEANNLMPQSSEITSMSGDRNELESKFQSQLLVEAQTNPNDISRAGIKVPV
jgi:hypothetical protein